MIPFTFLLHANCILLVFGSFVKVIPMINGTMELCYISEKMMIRRIERVSK